ncbi:MAG: response regulator [Jatrophihabitans sp.]|uniref:response regulator n=1 Tax=Jatrophihabitans sp. TaxID=1932789 RepID=UPI003F7DDA9F
MSTPHQPTPGHVLVVDDEPSLLRSLTMNLAGRGYRVTTATTGAAAVELAAAAQPDAVILDLGLPDLDGAEVIRRIRARTAHLPILVLSARSESREKVTALDLGADDYVTKPFDMNELFARLRAATRKVVDVETPLVAHLGPVTVDVENRIVHRDDGDGPTVVRLTPTEWRMLEALLRRPGRLITPTDLLTAVRGAPDHTESSYLRIYMQQLRRKLEVDPSRPRHLITEPGLGYRYQP